MGAYFRWGRQGRGIIGNAGSAASGYTIIEVMLFFAVTGALMLGVMGSASVGVNTQRYNDAVNTFSAILQQEFTNVTNVTNTKSVQSMCGAGGETELQRGVSDCVIIGRLMTIDNQGNMMRSNLVGQDSGAALDDGDTELEVVRSYNPKIDASSQETGNMSWETKILKGNPPEASYVSILLLRSPRSGNVYSYVSQSSTAVIANDTQLAAAITNLVGEGSSPRNSRDQFLCVDRSGWVVTPMRAIKLAPFSSGPSGVSIIDAEGNVCA